MPRPDYIPNYHEKPNSMIEALSRSLRYKVVDENGKVVARSAQWPHDYTMRKGWKIVDTNSDKTIGTPHP